MFRQNSILIKFTYLLLFSCEPMCVISEPGKIVNSVQEKMRAILKALYSCLQKKGGKLPKERK